MKLIIIICMYLTPALITGCVSVSTQNKTSMLKFSTILDFKFGTTSHADIVNILGEPSDIVEKNNYFVMKYQDPETNFQRLIVNIDKDNNKLLSLFWLPKEGESESSLDYAKKVFENTQYQVEEEKNIPKHMASSGILFYIDKKAGVTIRYDKRRDEVEAIALYDQENRSPALTK